MTAVLPKRSRISSSAPSSSDAVVRDERQLELDGRSSARFASAMPISVRPRAVDQRLRPASSSRAAREDDRGPRRRRGSVRERVAREKSSKRRRRTTVRPTRRAARTRRMTRSTSATRIGVDLLRRAAARGRARAASRSSGAAAAAHPAAGRGCASACRCRPGRPAEHRHERRLGHARQLADRRDARGRAAAPRSPAPTPHSASTGSGCRKSRSPSGGTSSSPSGFATRARHLGEELRAGDADRDRQADALAHRRAAAARDLERRAGDPLHARARRGTPRRSRAPRRAAWCPRRPRRAPCSPPM